MLCRRPSSLDQILFLANQKVVVDGKSGLPCPLLKQINLGEKFYFDGDLLDNFQKERKDLLDQQVEAGGVKRSFKFWITDPEMKAQWEIRMEEVRAN